MDASDLMAMVSALAAAIAKDRDIDEVKALAVVFNQLGYTLNNIANTRIFSKLDKKFEEKKEDKKEKE